MEGHTAGLGDKFFDLLMLLGKSVEDLIEGS